MSGHANMDSRGRRRETAVADASLGAERTPNGIALYAKIASILRTQIGSGHLPVGHRLPSIEQLSAHYQVAPVTIRQAVRLLVEEGILSSHRGRGTFVVGNTVDARRIAAHGASASPEIEVRTLAHVEDAPVPPGLLEGYRAAGRYEWIRKVHHQQERVFFMMDAFVLADIEVDLDAVAGNIMLLELIADEMIRRKATVITTVTVASADMETAELLKCYLSSPVAQLTRIFINKAGDVLACTRATYRSEVFHMRTEQTAAQFLATRTATSIRASD